MPGQHFPKLRHLEELAVVLNHGPETLEVVQRVLLALLAGGGHHQLAVRRQLEGKPTHRVLVLRPRQLVYRVEEDEERSLFRCEV